MILKFACVAYVPPKPSVVGPYGTKSSSDCPVERMTAMICAPASAAATAAVRSS